MQKIIFLPTYLPFFFQTVTGNKQFLFLGLNTCFASCFFSSKPLYGMKFVIIGKTPKPKAEIEKIVTSQGGEIISKVDKNTAACISTKGM